MHEPLLGAPGSPGGQAAGPTGCASGQGASRSELLPRGASETGFGVAGCEGGQVKWNGQTGAGAEPFRGARRVGRSLLLGSAHARAHGAGRTRAACAEREDFCCLGRKICCEILFTRCLCASWPQAALETRVGLHLPMGRGRSNTPPRRDAKSQGFGLAHFKGQRFPSKNRAVGMPAVKNVARLDGSRAQQSAHSAEPCPERGFARQPPVDPGWFLIVPADPHCPSLLSRRGAGGCQVGKATQTKRC